jgi:hypothetical protein
MSGNNTPLTQKSFDLYAREHQKYLDSKFDKLAEDQTDNKAKFKHVYKVIAIAFTIAIFVGLAMHVPGVQAAVFKVLKFLV